MDDNRRKRTQITVERVTVTTVRRATRQTPAFCGHCGMEITGFLTHDAPPPEPLKLAAAVHQLSNAAEVCPDQDEPFAPTVSEPTG